MEKDKIAVSDTMIQMNTEKQSSTMQISSQPESINLVEKLIDEIKSEYNVHEECYGNM